MACHSAVSVQVHCVCDRFWSDSMVCHSAVCVQVHCVCDRFWSDSMASYYIFAGSLFWVLALGVIPWHNTMCLPVHFVLDLGLMQCHNTMCSQCVNQFTVSVC